MAHDNQERESRDDDDRQRDLFASVHDLSQALLQGDAADATQQQLERLVLSSDDACWAYIVYMHESATLRRIASTQAVSESAVLENARDGRSIAVCANSNPQSAGFVSAAPASLAAHHCRGGAEVGDSCPARRVPATRGWLTLALAAAVALLGTGTFLLRDNDDAPAPAAAVVGTFSRSVNVRWTSGAHRWSVGDPLAESRSIEFDSGRVELQFDSGATMTVVGPANLEIQSAKRVALHSGTATTRIENGNSGEFRVVTPATEVLDLGTEFGVRARPGGFTDVVVFEGEVDVTPVVTAQSPSPIAQRLSIGEGVCVNARGAFDRVVSFDSDVFPLAGDDRIQQRTRHSLIVGVADDLRSPGGGKFYRIYREGFGEDVRAFVDRTHEWNGLTDDGMPAFLRGADYVATFNDDKKPARHAGPNTITVQLSGPALLYVLYDDRLVVPQWLSRDFEDTGFNVGLDKGRFGSRPFDVAVGPGRSIDVVCSIWQRRVESGGPVELGQVGAPRAGTDGQRVMYGIAAQPLVNP